LYIGGEEMNDNDRRTTHREKRMSETNVSMEDDYESGLYEIRIKGHLDNRRAAWFEGLTVTREENGCTLLSGRVDQAALFGLLRKVRDLGLPLLSLTRVDPGQ
jgi:hypothetical protein